jgi:hypothetical protein
LCPGNLKENGGAAGEYMDSPIYPGTAAGMLNAGNTVKASCSQPFILLGKTE